MKRIIILTICSLVLNLYKLYSQNEIFFEYDNKNRLIKASYSPDCRFVMYSYDNDGNRIFQNEHYFNITESIQHVDCTNPNGGNITLTSPIPVLNYQWSNGMTGLSISNLPAGHYSVVITESTLNDVCYKEFDIYNTSATGVITINVTDATCQTAADGSASVTIQGGSGSYSYLWSNGQTDSTATGLLPGIYSLTVTETISNCVQQFPVVIGSPSTTIVSTTSTNPTCNGFGDGSISAYVTGNVSSYQNLHWSNGQMGLSATNLAAGTYVFYATDSIGCMNTDTIILVDPLVLNLTGIVTNVSCQAPNDGIIFVQPSGGTAPYLLSLNGINYSPNPVFDSLTAGLYALYCIDSFGCMDTFNFTVNQTIPNNGLPITVIGDTLLNSPYTNAGSTWYMVGNPNPLAVGFQYICHASAQYFTIGYDQNFCQCTSDTTYACLTVGSNDLADSEGISIYPNPNNGEFIVSFSKNIGDKFFIRILDEQSRQVYFHENQISKDIHIDLSDLAKGLYSIQIVCEKVSYASMIIIF